MGLNSVNVDFGTELVYGNNKFAKLRAITRDYARLAQECKSPMCAWWTEASRPAALRQSMLPDR